MNDKKRILIIDDNKTLVKIAGGVLEKAGYETVFAMNGIDGIEIAQEQKPDLIILDIVMPGLDGYSVCTQLKNDKNTSCIPIIFLTSRGNTDNDKGAVAEGLKEIDLGFKCGAIDFVNKPVKATDLIKAVKNALWVSSTL